MKKFVLLLLIFLKITIVRAEQFEMIKEHSKIGFDIDYMMMTKVEGVFENYKSYFDFNPELNVLKNIKVEIYSNSINTNDKKRDFHLKGHEFFLVTSYPEITFNSEESVKIQTKENFKISGNLTIKDITKPITLIGNYKGQSLDPWGKPNYFFTFSGELNRKDFGIVWNKEMDNGGYLVGDIVKLMILVQAQASNNKTSFSTHMVPQTKAIKERMDLKMGKIKKLSTPTDPKDHKAPN